MISPTHSGNVSNQVSSSFGATSLSLTHFPRINNFSKVNQNNNYKPSDYPNETSPGSNVKCTPKACFNFLFCDNPPDPIPSSINMNLTTENVYSVAKNKTLKLPNHGTNVKCNSKISFNFLSCVNPPDFIPSTINSMTESIYKVDALTLSNEHYQKVVGEKTTRHEDEFFKSFIHNDSSPSKCHAITAFQNNQKDKLIKTNPYANTNNLIYINPDRQNKIHIFCVNIQSLGNKELEFENLVKTFTFRSKFNIVCISEYWLKTPLNLLGDYKLISHYCRPNLTGGGTAIYAKSNLSTLEIELPNITNIEQNFEYCAMFCSDFNTYVICIYRSNSVKADLSYFFLMLEQIMKWAKFKRTIICGDFNIDLLTNDKKKNRFL